MKVIEVDTEVAQVILVLFGLVFAAIGASSWLRSADLRRTCTERTEGIVTDHDIEARTSDDSDSGKRRSYSTTYYYYPIIEYTVNGVKYKHTSNFGSTKPRFEKGGAVTALYDPGDPNRVYIEEDKATAKTGPIFVVAGIGIMIVGLFLPALQEMSK